MKKILLFLTVTLFVLANIGEAQTIDDFNYAGNLSDNGWSVHSGAATNPIATTAGLTYSGYLNSGIGNAALVDDHGGQDINYTPGIGPYNTDGSVIYFSFMVDVTEPANKSGDYFIHIGDRSSTTSFTNFSARVFAKVNGGSVNFGLSNSSTATYGATAFSTNTTYLIVVKYVINNSGNDETDLWVIPSGIPASEVLAGSPEVSNTSTSGQNTIDGIALRQGSSSNSPRTVVDGIRIATTWNELLFVSEATAATNISATSFDANWNTVNGATGYYLDVATDAAFTSMVAGYNNLDVGNVTTYAVTGLAAGVTYHYRVRAHDAIATGPNSNTIDVTTIQLVLAATEAGALNYTEGDAATAITGSTTITSSVANLDGAVIQITGNYQNGEDLLQINNADLLGGVTSTWEAATGTLTITGITQVADYQAMIRNVKYQNTLQDPSTLQRTVSFTISTGAFNSNTVTRDITITPVNQAPVLAAIEPAVLSYNTGAAKQITNSITIGDVDNASLAGAVVQIFSNYDVDKDVLLFTNQNGITGVWTSATGTLTLTGTTTLSNYQAALRSVQFQNTSLNASNLQRTVTFTVNDGTVNSNIATRNIDVNNPPVLASIEGTQLAYSAGDPATPVTGTLTVNDVDNVNLASAVVHFGGYYETGKDVLAFTNANGITGNWDAAKGILTLTGASSVANYQAALRSITYQNTNPVPVKLIRTISFQVNDGLANSNAMTREINLGFLAPTLTGIESDALLYKQGEEGKIISSTVVINSPSTSFINSATIQITGNYVQGEDILTCPSQKQIISVWDPVEGKISLSWNTSVDNYESTLRSVTYKNVGTHPSTSTRTVSFTVTDEGYNVTNTVTRAINVSIITNVTIAVNPAEGGTVTGGGTYYSGDKVTVTAKPNTGYHLVNWTEGETEASKDTSFTFTISTDRNLTANFALNKCAVTTSSSPADGGTTTGSGTYDYGTSVTVTATPNTGYTFVNWKKGESVVSDSSAYSFTVSDNQNLVANFMLLPVLSVAQEFISVGAAAGSDSIKVINAGQGSMNWKAVSDIFWIKITKGSSGTNDGTIYLSYNNNNSAPRVGTITITADGVNGSPKIVEVRQDGLATYVENLNMGIPDSYSLEQNYPNPFNPTTKIRFGLPRESNVTVTIYNILGEAVATLVNGTQRAGYYEINFDAGKLASGIYIYRISADHFAQVRKMLLLK